MKTQPKVEPAPVTISSVRVEKIKHAGNGGISPVKSSAHIIVWLSSLVLIAAFMFLIPVFGWDISLSRALYHFDKGWENFSNDYGYLPWRTLEYLSWGLLAAGLILRKREMWRSGLFLALMGFLVTTFLVAEVLKPAFGRVRPYLVKQFGGQENYREWTQPAAKPVADEVHHSFPSGHAAAAAMAIVPFWVISQKRLRVLVLTLGLTWWFYISVGRVMMNVHFLSDTLASLWLTILCGGTLAWLIKPLAPTAAKKSRTL